MTPEVAQALASVGQSLADAREPWWVIGSAAVALHGVDTPVADIDVLVGAADADAIIARYALTTAPPDAHTRFRSQRFVRWARGDRDVELMVGLTVRDREDWRPVRPVTRIAFRIGDVSVFTPDRAELEMILRLFGRAKDLERLRLLVKCTGAPG